jgi:hypothetical protein
MGFERVKFESFYHLIVAFVSDFDLPATPIYAIHYQR